MTLHKNSVPPEPIMLTAMPTRAVSYTHLYQNYPLITKQRLFYEAMEEILPEVKLYIVDEQTGVQTALPLEQFATVNAGTAEGGASN